MNCSEDAKSAVFRRTAILAAAAGAAALAVLWRRQLGEILGVLFGAAVISFLLKPLCARFEKKLGRTAAAAAAVAVVAAAVLGLLALLLPSLIEQLLELWRSLPAALVRLRMVLEDATAFLAERGISIPWPDAGSEQLEGLAANTVRTARSLADALYRFVMMVILGCFFLAERERLLLRLELMLPEKMRAPAVRMGRAVSAELREYVKGQLTVASAVAVTVSTGLSVFGIGSPLALGALVGALNVIPYIGPWLGGIPVAVTALEGGFAAVARGVGVVVLAQQLDAWVLSPRIMGSITGISPALVLVGIFIGSKVAGITGMLLALPLLMSTRTLYRVFVQRNEND